MLLAQRQLPRRNVRRQRLQRVREVLQLVYLRRLRVRRVRPSELSDHHAGADPKPDGGPNTSAHAGSDRISDDEGTDSVANAEADTGS